MATFKFYTRTKVGTDKKMVPLHCWLRSGKAVYLRTKTDILVWPKQWSNKTHKLKYETEGDGPKITNTELSDLGTSILESLNAVPDHSKLTNEWLKETIDQLRNPDKYKPIAPDLFTFIRNFIDKAPTRPSPKTGRPVSYKMIREYERTYFYLKDFAAKKRRSIDFKDITLDFYHDFTQYLQSEKRIPNRGGEMVREPGLATNTIGKKIQTLKIFLNAAMDEGLNDYRHFKSHRFISIKEEADHIHLNEDELSALVEIDLKDNPRLDRIRDLFLIGAWTGLRFSDWGQINRDKLEQGKHGPLLKVRQSKTGNEHYIPINPIVTKILDKYAENLPRVPTNQRMNEYLKELGELAGINKAFQKSMTKAGAKITKTYKKYELIGTHTARRSFATNMYNKGLPSLSIMAVTGHKTESSFLKYIKVSPKEHADKFHQFWQETQDNEVVIRSIGA